MCTSIILKIREIWKTSFNESVFTIFIQITLANGASVSITPKSFKHVYYFDLVITPVGSDYDDIEGNVTYRSISS